MSINKEKITGVILAGGQARRMGGEDKGLIRLNDKPMIEYIIDALKPQTGNLIINANRNHDKYSIYDREIISDELSGFCGPLAGMASALQSINTDYMVTVPCDSPFVPDDLVKRLSHAFENNKIEISVAHNGERIQPVFCMLKKTLHDSLTNYLNSGERKIDHWFEQHAYITTDFSDIPETFDNINTPDDIDKALARILSD